MQYTQEELYTALQNADAAGDKEGAMQIAQMIQNYQPQERSMIQSVADVFTGNDRQTEEIAQLDEVTGSPEFGGVSQFGDVPFTEALGQLYEKGLSMPAFKSAAGFLTTSDPKEQMQIIKSNYPDAQFRQDSKGNIIVGLESGEYALNAPGLSTSDITKLVTDIAAFTPAGRAASVAGAAGKSAATQAAMEATGSATGGEFNTGDVAIAAATGGLTKKAEDAFGNLVQQSSQRAKDLSEEAINAKTGNIMNPLSQERQTAKLTEQLAKQSEARFRQDLSKIAGEVMPDTEVIKAAERLGVDESLTPGMVSKSAAYKDIEGALRAKGASDISRQAEEAILKVSQSADDLITDFGGSLDKAGFSEELKSRTSQVITDLDDQVTTAYDNVNKLVSPTQKVDMSDVYVELQQQAEDLGGDKYLEPFERRILSITEINPSYALIDKERKKIGAALHKKQGAYKDMDTGRLKRMYGLLTDAQGASLSDDALNAWNVAKGLTSQRKQLEEKSIKMFGDDLSEAFMPKFGNAVKKLQKSDYGDFDKLIAAIPDREMRERAMVSALNDVFVQGSRKEKSMNIPGFVDWYESILRQPALMKRINENLPAGSAERLKDLFTVSKAMRDANSRVIKTGVAAETLSGLDKAQGMFAKLYDVTKQMAAAEGAGAMMGAPGIGATAVVTNAMMSRAKDPLAVSADRLISSPEFKRLAIQMGKDNFKATQATAAAERALRKSEKYKRWFDRLPSENKRAIIKGGLTSYLITANDEY